MSNSSRTSNAIKNISTGIISQALQMVLGFVSRTIFIKYLAVEYLGVNSLFTNILSMLSLAEMGLGSAFLYALYKPLADKDEIALASIIAFYKKVYQYIGAFIFITGIALLPFLDAIIPQKPAAIVEDIRLIYVLFLFNSASSYFFSYKISILDADQKGSVFALSSMKFLTLQSILQIIVLISTRSFILYLLVQIICNLGSNFYISRIIDKRYPFLLKHKSKKIDDEVKDKIIKNTKATFLVKIGGVLVNGTDNIIINYFVGLAILGKYSNYIMFLSLATSILVIFFNNIKSSITNVLFTENKQVQNEIFSAFNFITFWLYGATSLMIIFLLNDLIVIWIGKFYILSTEIVIVAVINFFMLGMQNTFWIFKSGYGLFRHGRYMVLFTAFFNLLFSFILGSHYGIFGVLLATSIARLVTNFWYDPYIVLKLGLHQNPQLYLFKFAKYLFVLLLSGILIYCATMFLHFQPVLNLIIKSVICFIISNAVIIMFFYKTQEFKKIRSMLNTIFTSIFVRKSKI